MSISDLNKINELIGLNEFSQAKIELVKIVNVEPNNIEALKMLGLCNVNLACYSEGKNNFETVVKYKNDDATSWFYLANCYDNLDDFMHAKTAYLEVIKLRENYMDAYKNLGVIYIKMQDNKSAFELAKKALEITQDDYIFYYLAGTALLAEKNFEDCLPYFENAVKHNPSHPQLYNNMGTAHLSLKNHEKAYECYQKAAEINPKNAITFYNMASILQIKGDFRQACEYFEKAYFLEDSEQFLLALALCEFRSEYYEKAIGHYKILVAKHPEKHNFQYNLACCYEMIGEYIYSIGILEQLVLLNPKSTLMSQKLANLYLKIEQPLKAKEIYERIINQGIVTDEIYYEYALICVTTNDLDIAEKILKKVVELNPSKAMARKDLGVIYLGKRLFDYAREEFEKAYELESENPSIIFEYANFLHSSAEYEKAQSMYEKAILKFPQNAGFYVFSALNLIMINRIKEAKEKVDMALKLLPEDDFVLYTAGRVYYMLENYEQAQLLLIKAWEKNPTPDCENLLALNYYAQNEWKKAQDIFSKLSKDNPMNTSMLINSAKCFEKMGEIDLAIEKVQKVLEVLPESEEANDMLKILSKEKK